MTYKSRESLRAVIGTHTKEQFGIKDGKWVYIPPKRIELLRETLTPWKDSWEFIKKIWNMKVFN